MADQSGPSNALSGGKLEDNTQGTQELEGTTSLHTIGGSPSPEHDPGCITPRCFPLHDLNENEEWCDGLEEIDTYFPNPHQRDSQGDNNFATEISSSNVATNLGETQFAETQFEDAQNRANPQYTTAENNTQGGNLTGDGIDLNHHNNEGTNPFNYEDFIHEEAYAPDNSTSHDLVGETGNQVLNQVNVDSEPSFLEQEYVSGNGNWVDQHTPEHNDPSVRFDESTLSAPGAVHASSNFEDPTLMANVPVQGSPSVQNSAFTSRVASGPNFVDPVHHPTLGAASYDVPGHGELEFSELEYSNRDTSGSHTNTILQQHGTQNTPMMPTYYLGEYSAFARQHFFPGRQMSVSDQVMATSTEHFGQNYEAPDIQPWNSSHSQFHDRLLGTRTSMMGDLFSPDSSTLHLSANISGFPASTEDTNTVMNENQQPEATVAQDITGPPTTVNDNTYTNIFPDWNAVVAYENQREDRPEYDQDRTVPQSVLEHQLYVKQIVQAIRDTSNTRDYPADAAAQGRKAPQAYLNFVKNRYTEVQIQVVAWKVLVKCKEKQRKGCLLSRDQSSRKPVMHESFRALVDEVCMALKQQKSICKRLLDAEFFNEFIDNPDVQLKRAAQNKRLNETKATQIAMGRTLQGGMKRAKGQDSSLAEGGKAEGGELDPVSDAGEDEVEVEGPPPKKRRRGLRSSSEQ